MNTTPQHQHPRRRLSAALVFSLMIAAGIARITLATVVDFEPSGNAHTQASDTVTIRRNVQLVTCGIQALLVQCGLAATGGSALEHTQASADEAADAFVS